jgi:hypothetical protein
MTTQRVILVHLGRAGGMGTWVRIAGLRAVFEAAGATVAEIPLRTDHRPRLRDLRRVSLPDLIAGRAVPETLAWSPASTLARLQSLDPAVVLCCTSRAFHPVLTHGRWHMVLDFVDRLSVSYRDRSTVEGIGLERYAMRALAWPNERFEVGARKLGVETIAAGWSDARDLGATWVPITVPIPTHPADVQADHDLVFFGNLAYPPNVEAVQRLSRFWPRMLATRPTTTMLVAGRNPVASVRSAAEKHDWALRSNYPDVNRLLASARLGVVPLEHASGIQIKVLETAAFGLAQVVSPAARAGLGPDFPAVAADSDDSFVLEVARLLDDDAERTRLAEVARQHMVEHFTTDAWTPWAREVLERSRPS